MTNCVQLRRAQIQDAAELHKIINIAYRTDAGWTSEAEYVKNDRISFEQLVKLIEFGTDPIMVAQSKEDDSILGCIQAELSENHSNYGLPQNSALLGLFAVDPLRQSSGIGGKLLQGIIDHVKQEYPDVNTLIMWVIEGRDELINWYVKKGFKWNGQFKDFVSPENLIKQGARFKILERII